MENQNASKPTEVKPNAGTTFFQQFFVLPPKFQGGPITISLVEGTGIPMRDYFAAKISGYVMWDSYSSDPDRFPSIARDCYKFADAMIKAREEKRGQDSQFHGDYLKRSFGEDL